MHYFQKFFLQNLDNKIENIINIHIHTSDHKHEHTYRPIKEENTPITTNIGENPNEYGSRKR